jgi:tetratricopeptide (TPR) repeat protein
LGARLEALVYRPFKTIVQRGSLVQTPYVIVIDGLDECEDEDGVRDFLNFTLRFFKHKPLIPLRLVITSRVEQHIHSCLNGGGARLKDLAYHFSKEDMDSVFNTYSEGNRVVQEYIREHGPWPNPTDARNLVDHIGGSFTFASALFSFIFNGSPGSQDNLLTPMQRLPLALNIHPDFDALYSVTLARSERVPHFCEVIATLTLLDADSPLPVAGVAELLGLSTHEVVRVLVDLQAIIQLPTSTESDVPVTFCHTSLRDFLTNKDRSGRFHAPPAFHLRLFFQCFIIVLKDLRQKGRARFQRSRQTAAAAYAAKCENFHWERGQQSIEDEAVSGKIYDLFSKARTSNKSWHASDLDKLGIALLEIVKDKEVAFGLEGVVSLHREALGLRPSFNKARLSTLENLGIALCLQFENNGFAPAVEEAISIFREILDHRPPPHHHRATSLNNLGVALYARFQHTQLWRVGVCVSEIEEVIKTHREALQEHRSPSHHDRAGSLNSLGNALHALYEHESNRNISHVEEAIALYREARTLQDQTSTLSYLGDALRSRGEHSGRDSDYDEALSLLKRSLELTEVEGCLFVSRRWPLMNIGITFYSRFSKSGSAEDLDEAICHLRKSLDLIPPRHIYRHKALQYLIMSLQSRYDIDRSPLPLLKDAVTHTRELLNEHYTTGHRHRKEWLCRAVTLLQTHFEATHDQDSRDEAAKFGEELT